MKILKIILISVGLLILLVIGLFFGSTWYYSWQDSEFYNIETPKGFDYEKRREYLSRAQIDSIEVLGINTEKIEVVGTGYGGYDFYMWHKPIEKGEIYIKAFEITKERRLSASNLTERTKNAIYELSDDYHLYKGNTIIYEGTFEKYYPARFELWFKSAQDGTERKLAEKSYLIDGWDR